MILTDYLRFLLALAAVLGLIALFAWVARRFRLGGLSGSAMKSGRLEVLESLPIDGRQRLVLIRRDDREHLLLLGQERSVVIEVDAAAQAEPLAALDAAESSASFP